MPHLLGEASGGFKESSSALRVLHGAISNSLDVLTDDAFTQTNPPIVTTAGTISAQVNTTQFGVLSGSVAFTRPDAALNGFVGPNVEGLADASLETFIRPLGVFVNNANGNAFENRPGQASGKGPFMNSGGTYANGLFETQVLGAGITNFAVGDDLPYVTGVDLIASRNGYLMPRRVIDNTSTVRFADIATIAAEVEHGSAASTTIAVLKVPADSELNELVYDQRL